MSFPRMRGSSLLQALRGHGGVFLAGVLAALFSTLALAGAQKYEPLSDAVRSQLTKAVSDAAVDRAAFGD